MNKIIGIGNALVDAVVVLKEEKMLEQLGLPKGSMQLIDRAKYEAIANITVGMTVNRATGGAAANTCLTLARIGADVGFIGKMSDDSVGDFFAETFRTNGVKLNLLPDVLPSGICTSFVSADGERTMATYLGAAANMKPEDIKPELFAGYSHLYLEGYLVQDHNLITKIVDTAKFVGLKTSLDLASYNVVADNRDFFESLLPNIDIVFANEEEASAFANGGTAKEALNLLAELCPVAVVKVGKNGVWVKRDAELVEVEAMNVANVLDTTGAGDAFSAGFLYGYTRNLSLERCAVVGNLLAGEVIQSFGASLPVEREEKVKAKVEKIINA